MRGKIISYSTHKKRKEKADLLELENKIKTLETAYAASAQEHILGDMKNLKLQLNDIINKQTQFQIQRLRLERYENSNKSGKFLANQLKINKEKSTITSIMDQTGNVTHDPVKINNAFKDFYQNLYTPQINPSEQSINSFLNNINLPKLNEDQITNLDSPLSLSELHEALSLMPNGKAPGPDGFPAEFYKEFWEQLAPTFYKTVKFINESQSLSPNMNSANIILLLKPDKDPTSPSSYRPISLINADVKIIYNSGDDNHMIHETNENVSRCDTCAKVFGTKLQMKKHRRIHTCEKQFLCSTCGKKFRDASTLKHHVRTHTGERPFPCQTCGRSFWCCGKLMVHSRIHTGDKPYLCNTCGRGFSQSSALKRHTTVHTESKLYSCRICGKGFSQNSDVTVHLRTHTGEKPYTCNTCGRRFSDSSAFKRHTAIHVDMKPYSCQICSKSFRQSGHLMRHMSVHSGERSFSCQECGKSFRQGNNLVRHRRACLIGSLPLQGKRSVVMQ
uniref:C2H2-type domain-containing protein n=1 Tax=Oryzias latipes TaxID=8090 RepID=A0A3P9JK99_ORYLA